MAFINGEDSLVMLDLIQCALPNDSFEVIFGDTTMELSDTYKTVEDTREIFSDSSLALEKNCREMKDTSEKIS